MNEYDCPSHWSLWVLKWAWRPILDPVMFVQRVCGVCMDVLSFLSKASGRSASYSAAPSQTQFLQITLILAACPQVLRSVLLLFMHLLWEVSQAYGYHELNWSWVMMAGMEEEPAFSSGRCTDPPSMSEGFFTGGHLILRR